MYGVNDEVFQGSSVMLFGLCKGQVRLADGAARMAVKPGNIDDQLDLATSDWKHLESPRLVAESDDTVRSATRTLQCVRMNIAVEDRLVQKTTFLYCTPGIPNV